MGFLNSIILIKDRVIPCNETITPIWGLFCNRMIEKLESVINQHTQLTISIINMLPIIFLCCVCLVGLHNRGKLPRFLPGFYLTP
jgi:hypothetical protein